VKLIIQKTDRVYASIESNKHFKEAEKHRQNLRRLDPKVLDDECDLSYYGDNFYIVIPVKKKPVKAYRA
jgi:hypothetical protein